jgi:hypothetical protein
MVYSLYARSLVPAALLALLCLALASAVVQLEAVVFSGPDLIVTAVGGPVPPRALILMADSRSFAPIHTHMEPEMHQLAASINHYYALCHGYEFRCVHRV